MRIAVDVGYGMVKGVGETGRRVLFPRVVTPAVTGTRILAAAMGRGEEDYRLQFWPHGRPDQAQKVLIGEAALAARGAVRAWDKEVSCDPYLRLFVAAACTLVGANGSVQLVVGLPLALYGAQRAALRNALGGTDSVVVVNDGTPARVRVESVMVFPQAAGVYYAACLCRDGSVRDGALIRQPVGVIDVGYRTTDYLVMQRGPQGLAPRDDLAGSLDVGMNHALQEAATELERQTGAPVDLLQVERALAWGGGRLYVRGREHDARAAHEEAVRRLAERVAGRVKLAWGDDGDHLAAVLVGGGGGAALYPYLAAHFSGASLVEDPIYANAEGYLAAQALHLRTVAVS